MVLWRLTTPVNARDVTNEIRYLCRQQLVLVSRRLGAEHTSLEVLVEVQGIIVDFFCWRFFAICYCC